MADNKQIIADLNQYCDPRSILILDKDGKLRRIQCPFKVVTLCTFHIYSANVTVEVSAVKITLELLLVYVVEGVAFPYYLFRIVL
jgi:hypothetical protein